MNDGKFALGLTSGFVATVCLALTLEWSLSDFVRHYPLVVSGAVALFSPIIAALIAVYYSERSSRLSRRRDLRSTAETAYTKIFDIQDAVLKQYQHHFSSDPRHRLLIPDRDTQIIKPLEGIYRDIVLSPEERSLGFQIRKASIVNALRDAQGIFDNLEFLRTAHQDAFHKIQSQALHGDVAVRDRIIATDAVIRQSDLIRLEESQEHLRSLLLRSVDEMKKIHDHLLETLREEFGRSVDFKFDYSVSAQAPNVYRQMN